MLRIIGKDKDWNTPVGEWQKQTFSTNEQFASECAVTCWKNTSAALRDAGLLPQRKHPLVLLYSKCSCKNYPWKSIAWFKKLPVEMPGDL